MRTALLALPLTLLVACAASTPKASDHSSPIPATAAKDNETVYKVIPLKYAVARELAVTLRGAVATPAGRAPVQIVPDERTNSLVVTCSRDGLASIEHLIAALDIPVKQE